jgi:hypothetical protein
MAYYTCKDPIVIDLFHELYMLEKFSGSLSGRYNRRREELSERLKERLELVILNPFLHLSHVVPVVVYETKHGKVWVRPQMEQKKGCL